MLLPVVLRFGNKIPVEQKEYLRTNRYDAATGRHVPYSKDERAAFFKRHALHKKSIATILKSPVNAANS